MYFYSMLHLFLFGFCARICILLDNWGLCLKANLKALSIFTNSISHIAFRFAFVTLFASWFVQCTNLSLILQLASCLGPHFYQNIFKCKQISETGAQQVLIKFTPFPCSSKYQLTVYIFNFLKWL